ncbi:hypothetical protein ACQP2X_39750 [Actinoplanes sp. CA-131856]
MVAAEVEVVLKALRRRLDWFAMHIERPLEFKPVPSAPLPDDGLADRQPLFPPEPGDADDARLKEIARVKKHNEPSSIYHPAPATIRIHKMPPRPPRST